MERLSDFTLRHGEAVSIGMVAAALIAVETGRCDSAFADRIRNVLAAWDLPVESPSHPVDEIREAMAHDKKLQGRGLRWVLPRAIGDVETAEDVPTESIRSALLELGAKGER